MRKVDSMYDRATHVGIFVALLTTSACGDDASPGGGGSGQGAGGATSSSDVSSATGGPATTTSGTSSAEATTTTTGSEATSSSGAGGSGGAAASCPGDGPSPGDHDHELVFDGDTRQFRVHLPPDYGQAGPHPVVLVFHGYLMNGGSMEDASQMTPAADARGAVVVYAEGRSSSWNAGACCGSSGTLGVDDVGFVGAMIDVLLGAYCIDPRRVYAAGFSNGGMLSHRLACELSDRIAAIGPVAGTLALPACSPSRPMPVMHTHGTSDLVVPYAGGGFSGGRSVADTIDAWRSANACPEGAPATVFAEGDATCVAHTGCAGGSEVRLCTVEGGGHQWPGGESILGGGTLSMDLPTSEALLEFFEEFSLP